MPGRFKEGECAWISGASSGIGRAVALQLAREGVMVFLSARREDHLHKLYGEITSEGGRAKVCPLDITNPDAIQKTAEEIKTLVQRLDIVIPCAGHELLSPFQIIKPEKLRQIFDINVIGAVEMVRSSLPLIKEGIKRGGGQGRIVFVSSVSAIRGSPAISAYSAAKAALLGITKSLAVELAPLRIRVNAVVPGMVKTDMQERMFARMPKNKREELESSHLLGLGNPEDVTAAISFLCSYESQWITGESMVVDGGFSIS